MVVSTKIFKNGNSKAVRLPKSFGFSSDKVILKKVSNGIAIMKADENIWNKWWDSFEKSDLQRMQGTQKREEIF